MSLKAKNIILTEWDRAVSSSEQDLDEALGEKLAQRRL